MGTRRVIEDDNMDSGAETGESDCSQMSSIGSELSLEGSQDPFLVVIHFITDPGCSDILHSTIHKLLRWVTPDWPLFCAAERASPLQSKKSYPSVFIQPALSVIIFLQEKNGDERILQLHDYLLHPPWQYHHTEHFTGKILPYMPCTQDFFSLADGMPLWAIRQVHYGKEIIRYTIYCSFDHFEDMVALYKVILAHKVSFSKSDFCYFTLYSTSNIDLQLSFKKLPKDMFPTPTESTVLEFRVQELAQVVTVLPKPCSPVSDIRWQTEDYDGNKILLQVRSTDCLWRKCSKMHRSVLRISPAITGIANSPDQHCAFERNRNCGLQYESRHQQTTLTHKQRDHFKEECFYGDWSRGMNGTSENSWYAQQSGSPLSSHLFRNVSLTSALSTLGSESSLVFCNKDESARDSFGSRINIVDLEDAEETDVDTGLKTFHSDLSIVSGYTVPDVSDKRFHTSFSSVGHTIMLPDSTMRMEFSRSKASVRPTEPLCQLLKKLSPTDIQPHFLPLQKHLPLKYEPALSLKEEEFYI